MARGYSRGHVCVAGVCMVGTCMGDMVGEGCAWQGAVYNEGCSVHGRGHVW